LVLQETRKSDKNNVKECEEKLKQNHDLKQLEALLNELPYFKDFQFENKMQVSSLLNLFKFTQIALINSLYCYKDATDRSLLLKGTLIHLIKSDDEFNDFKNRVTDTIIPLKKSITEFWIINNLKFLHCKLEMIKKDFKEKNIFYFYTTPDFKLFRLEVLLDRDKLKLKREYINRDYYWFNAFNGISDNYD